MNAIILKCAAFRQPPLPKCGPRAKTIAHPWSSAMCDYLNTLIAIQLIILEDYRGSTVGWGTVLYAEIIGVRFPVT
jgi:hypothetical protein